MAIPSTQAAISLGNSRAAQNYSIQSEYGGSNPAQLSEYYRAGTYVPDAPSTQKIAKSGAQKFSNYFGTSSPPPFDLGPNPDFGAEEAIWKETRSSAGMSGKFEFPYQDPNYTGGGGKGSAVPNLSDGIRFFGSGTGVEHYTRTQPIPVSPGSTYEVFVVVKYEGDDHRETTRQGYRNVFGISDSANAQNFSTKDFKPVAVSAGTIVGTSAFRYGAASYAQGSGRFAFRITIPTGVTQIFFSMEGEGANANNGWVVYTNYGVV